uniref:Uncharacterized protein n=1 Tax=Arundo donax TaxID=35708 RepID=A0A0A9GC98_ARUDO
MLDKFDADGEGACLRYTNPSFFRTNSAKLGEGNLGADGYLKGPYLKTMETRKMFQNADNFKPPNSAHADSKSETDTSENASPGFLSMLRRLKQRQTNGSVFPGLRLQQKIQKYESSAEEKPSSVDHSEIDISFTCSSECNIDITVDASIAIVKAKDDHQGIVQLKDSPATYYSSDAAGSDNRGNRNELERTSSFEAWLSPEARFTPDRGIIEEASRDASEACVSNAITSNSALSGAKNAKQNSNNAAEMSYQKGVSKRSRYKGSVEMIASRVSSLPRKLFMKQQHDPVRLLPEHDQEAT